MKRLEKINGLVLSYILGEKTLNINAPDSRGDYDRDLSKEEAAKLIIFLSDFIKYEGNE